MHEQEDDYGQSATMARNVTRCYSNLWVRFSRTEPGCYFYGEFSTSVGVEGVVNHGIGGVGFLLFALCIIVFFGMLASNSKALVPRTREDMLLIGHECGVLVLNLVFYGGTAFVALAALTALDRSIVMPLVVIALCIGLFVLYRRHRKRNKMVYAYASQVGLLLFLLALFGFGLFAGTTIVSESATDLIRGPQTISGIVSDVEKDRPTGRYSAFSATTIELDFETLEGKTVHVSIKQQDKQALQQIVDTEGYARVTFYPETQVFVSAQSL